MTQPGGHGNDINLAALWIPIMPETSHLQAESVNIGRTMKRGIEEGFNSGTSPEAMGQSFGSRVSTAIGSEFKKIELPFGASAFLDKFSSDIDQKLVSKLRGEASQALSSYRTEWEKLQAAQEKAADVESKLNLARDNNIRSASVVLPLMQQQKQAQDAVTESHSKATAALDLYKQKQTELGEETSKAVGGSQALAIVVGGALVVGAQLAVSAVENLVEAIGMGFEKAIDITKELAQQAVELGETYEHIGIQITEFSTATGEKFEGLESSAQRVFSTLDVAGQDTGKTMAQFASMLNTEASPALEQLTRQVTELQGRYTDLRSADLASIFVAFKTPVQETGSALASLLQSARNSGQDIGQLTSALSGDAAVTLHEAGLNIQQAGMFMGDLLKLGAPGRSVMMGLQSAMKDFGSVGLSFGDGMKLAGERLKELGDTEAGQDLAEKLFGTRRWATAMQAVQDYIDVVNQGPDAFRASASATDDFLRNTEQLGNKIEAFKHQAENAFKPFGDAAKNAVVSGLNVVSAWFAEHHTEIIEKIKEWGDKLIDFIPVAQKWAADSIRILSDFASAMLIAFQPVEQVVVAAGAGFLALSGHFKDAFDLLKAGTNFDPMKIENMGNNLADKIQNIKIDTDSIKENFNDAADAALRIPTQVGNAAGQQILAGPGAPGSPPGGPGVIPVPPGGVGSPGSPGGPTNPLTAPMSGTDPASVKALAQQLFPWPASEWPAYEKLEMAEAGFDPTAKNASGAFGVGQFLGHEHDQYAAGYSTDPATQLKTQFQYISDRYGTPSAAWAQYYQHPGGAGSYQSGGYVGSSPFDEPTEPIDAAWLRLWWDHKQGHAGSIPIVRPEGHAGGGAVIDPLLELMSGRHGTTTGGGHYMGDAAYSRRYMVNQPPWIADSQAQQATHTGSFGPFNPSSTGIAGGPGNINPGVKIDTSNIDEGGDSWFTGYLKRIWYLQNLVGRNLPQVTTRATGGPAGTDTVPAWLTPGEYVWDTKTVGKYGWLIKALHNGPGLQSGGPVDDSKAGVDPQLQFIAQVAQGFGLDLGSGFRDPNGPAIAGVSASSSLHGSGEAQDFGNKSQRDQMLAFATYVFEHFGGELAELIHDDPRWTHNVKDGKDVGPMGQFYTTAQAGDHTDHVHVGIRKATSLYDQLSPGNEPLSAGIPGLGDSGGPAGSPGVSNGSIPGGRRGSAFPGVPGQYGGSGAYGGETADEAYSTSQAVQAAQDHAKDLDWQIGQQNQTINTLKDQIAHVGDTTKTDALGIPVPLTPAEQTAAGTKRAELQRQLDAATHQLDVSTRERGEQDGKISEAKRKQLEAYYKKPGGTTGTAEKAVGTSEFSQLGSSLLGGIGQELGFGDLFAKPPWEWGAVKLLTGAASWALGTANAWAEQIGQGKTGIGGPGWGGNSGVAAPGWGQQGSSLLSGLAGSFGINIPKAATPQSVSSGPNIVQPDTTQHGTGQGQAPGPVNIDNSINVQAGVDPGQILQPVQEQQNANNASLHTFTGGMPQ